MVVMVVVVVPTHSGDELSVSQAVGEIRIRRQRGRPVAC